MKNKFMLGAASGITTLMLAVPVLAQVSGAQETSDAATSAGKSPIAFSARAPLSQENVQSLIDKDTAFLANIDAMVTLQKSAVQTRLNALTAAASIEDETVRQEAVQAAQEAYRTTVQDALEANPDLKSGMQMGFGKAPHGGRGPNHGRGQGFGAPDFTGKLGMTQEELKAELDSGKTIEQIAEEKGVELPMKKGMRGGPGHLAETFGMTEAELQAELDSGKTIEQIAEEKGIDLPARPPFMGGGMRGNASSAQ